MQQVGKLPGRIRANDDEIVRCAEVAVGGAGWEQHDIPGFERHFVTGRSAEDHRNAAATDAQHFMGGAVVVVERENAVLPGSLPAVVDKPPFDPACTARFALNRDRPTPEQHREAAVRECAVV